MESRGQTVQIEESRCGLRELREIGTGFSMRLRQQS